MVDLQAQATTFRASGYHYTGYIGTIPETVIYTAFVNMATITYPVKAITFDGGVGTFANVKDGMEVLVYHQNTSTLKGRLRAILDGSSVGLLQVNEFSQGYLDLADNDRLEVVEAQRIHDKLIEAATALRKDSRITYTDQGANPNPVANAGGGDFGFINRNSNYRRVYLYPDLSFVTDPDGGTLTYSINGKDGILESGALSGSLPTGAPIVLSYAPGFRHAELLVTNSGSGKTATKQIPIGVYNGTSHRPLAVRMDSADWDETVGGFTIKFSLPRAQENAITSLPDGAFICYFEKEFYGSSEISYGSNVPYRSHIKFVGYLVRESITINARTNEISFEAVSPLHILEKTPALAQLIENKASPAKWTQLKNLTVNRALWYLLWWHTSFMTLFDFLWLDSGDLAYGRLTLQNIDNTAAQLRDIADSLNVHVSCDRNGRLLLVREGDYLSTSERNAREVTYVLEDRDVIESEIPREHRSEHKLVRVKGVTSANKPIHSRAPGAAPAQDATGIATLDRQIMSDQADGNTRAGHHYAHVNSLFYDTTTKAVVRVPKRARLVLPDSYDVFDPAYFNFVKFVLASTSNARGIGFTSSSRWTIRNLSIRYDVVKGGKEITLSIDHETYGIGGEIDPQPSSSSLSIPPVKPLELTFPGFDFTLPANTFNLPRGTQNMAVILGNSLRATTDFDTPSHIDGPAWSGAANNLGNPATIGTLLAACRDPYSPVYLGTGATANAYFATTTGIYRVTSIAPDGTFSVGSAANPFISSVTGNNRRIIDASPAAQGWVMVISYYYDSGGIRCAYSTNAHEVSPTWSEVEVTAHYNTLNNSQALVNPVLVMSPTVPGLAFTIAFTSTGSQDAANSALFVTDDFGATWAEVSGAVTNEIQLGCALHMPQHNNPNNNIFYWSLVDVSGGTAITQTRQRLYRSIGTLQEDVSPVYDLGTGWTRWAPGRIQQGYAIHSSANDRLHMAMSGIRNTQNTTHNGVWISRDGGETWINIVEPNTSGAEYTGCFVGDDGESLTLWGESRLDYATTLDGVLDSRYGDLPAGTIRAVIGL